jgi:hypothetical protein
VPVVQAKRGQHDESISIRRNDRSHDRRFRAVIRKDIIETVPLQRMLDTLDYHSSPQEAAQHFSGAIEIGDDLHRIEITPT